MVADRTFLKSMTLYLSASLSFSDKSINCYKSRGAFCSHEIIKVSNAQQAVFRVLMVLVHFLESVELRVYEV